MKATTSADGKLALPEELRRTRLFEAGTQFDVVPFGEASFLLKKITTDAPSASGSMAEWLFSCPEKDWFTEPRLVEIRGLARLPTRLDTRPCNIERRFVNPRKAGR